MKKNTFVEGTIFASLAYLLIKILGAVYVIPFYAIVGTLGGALYSYAYTVYSLIINMCTIGIPNAISKIVSEYNTLEMYEAKERTLKLGNKIIAIMSTILFLITFIFAKQIAYIFIGNLDDYDAYKYIVLMDNKGNINQLKVTNGVNYYDSGLSDRLIKQNIVITGNEEPFIFDECDNKSSNIKSDDTIDTFRKKVNTIYDRAISQFSEDKVDSKILYGDNNCYDKKLKISNSINDVILVIRAISFCLLIIPYLAIKKGYLQGQKFVTVSSNSEVIEQFVRVSFIIIGSFLVVNIFKLDTSLGVAVAVFGAFIAGLSAFIYLNIKIKRNKDKLNYPKKGEIDKVENKTIIKKIIAFSIPLMIISISTDLYCMTDLSLVIRGLSYLGYDGASAETIASVISTWAIKICLIVNAVTMGLSINIIPHMVSSFIKKDYKDINNQFTKSIGIALVIGFPMSVGISLLSHELYLLFYGASEFGGIILRLLPYAIFISNINLVVNSVLQSLNKYKVIYLSTISGLLLNALLDIPLMILCHKIGIYDYYGAILATLTGSSLSVFISFKALKKSMDFEYTGIINIIKKELLPLFSMVLVVLGTQYLLKDYFTSRMMVLIPCLICAFIGAIVYGLISYKNGLLYDVFGNEYVNSILKKIKLKK